MKIENEVHGKPPAPFLDEAKALACVHCGLCLGACPTYLETGNENDSPRGRIYIMRALQAGRLPLSDASVGHIDLCLGCRACEPACPSGVQYGALLETTREHIEHNYRRSAFQTFLRRVVIEGIFPFRWRLKWALRTAGALKLLGARLLPKLARDALDLIPDDSNAVTLPEFSPATRDSGKCGRVGFISGCVMSVMFGRTNRASVRLLNRIGYDVVIPRGQVCCGALSAHSGNLEKARSFARHNIDMFEQLNLDAIVTNAAGCGSTLKEYGHLLEADSSCSGRARSFSAKVKDLTEFLASVAGPDQFLNLVSRSSARVTYHDACHLAHPQRITRQPRHLVRAVAGRNYVELAESDVCCGSAGSYNLTEPEMAERLRQRKIQNIVNAGADVVVTTNPGCILQIRAGLKKAGAEHVRVLHIADFLEQAADTATGSSAPVR